MMKKNGLSRIVTFRVLSYIVTQPAAFFFILSLFLIAITLSVLGVYVTDSEMPDLDAMKNWNAYVGKLGDKDFCFKQSSKSFYDLHQGNGTNTTFVKKDDSCAQPLTNFSSDTYGTVHVALNFTIREFLFSNLTRIYSQFTGKHVGTQIRDSKNGNRIDSKIFLRIWINLSNYVNITCQNGLCPIKGCLLISAPLTAVPTRMPHIHKDFSFSRNVINSSKLRRPTNCSCQDFLPLNESHTILNLDIAAESNCVSLLDIVRQKQRHTRGYGIINIKLNKTDRSKASHHMYLAAISTAALGVAFIVGIMFTNIPGSPKKSQE